MPNAAKHTLLVAVSLLGLVAVSVVGAAGGAPPGKDREDPSAPKNLRVTAATQTLVRLAWDASTDNIAVAGYYIIGDRGKATLQTRLDTPEYTLSGLACGQSSNLTVIAFDDAQNRSEKATLTVSSAPCTDTLPPTTPGGFIQVATSDDAVVLAWNPSADNVGVVGYGVYRNLQWIASPSDPTVPLAGLACGSSYEYTVDAVDAAGNHSLFGKAQVQTGACPSSSPPPPAPSPDTQAPSTPSGLAAASITQTALTLSWNASTDNVQVTGYDLYRDGTKVASPSSPGASQSGLACGTSYTFAVEALDAAGNRSSRATLTTSTSACSTTPPPPTDTQPPSTPTGLGVASATRTSASLSWNPSTDNVAVAGYRSYRDGTYQSTTTQPPTTVSGLSCGSAYTFAVDAFDEEGNASNRASVIGSTLACPDTQAPSAPTGVVASSRTATSIALTWNASTDNFGVVGYGLYRPFAATGSSSSTTGIFSGLTCNTNYTLAVDAYDAAGNRSDKTTVMVATTACPDTTPPSAPTGLAASSVTQTSLALAWNASSDNVGVTGYDVYRNTTKMVTVTSTSSSQTGLACGTGYTFGVVSFDAAGNRSPQTQLNASTSACSAPPPPAGLSIVSPTQGTTVSGQVTLRAYDADPNVTWLGFYACDGNSSYEDHVRTNGYWEVVWDSTTCPNGDRNLAVFSFDDGGNILDEVSTWALIVSNTATPPPPSPPPPSDCDPASAPGAIANQGYSVVFKDCFSVLDRNVWADHQWWEPSPPTGTQFVDSNGILHIQSRRSDGYPNNTISSEPLGQANPKSFKQGYFEARFRWTAGNGSTPAFWLFSTRHATNPAWPNVNPYCQQNGLPVAECYSGEIDVFEAEGHQPTTFIGSAHRNSCGCYGVANQLRQGVPTVDIGVDMTTGFHTYGLLWTATTLSWYLDGNLLGSTTPFDSGNQPMHLMFYQWPQSWTRDPDATTPNTLDIEVDWVRVWQK